MIRRIYIIDEIAANWKKVGLVLGIPTNDLSEFAFQYRSEQDRCIEMMTCWLLGQGTKEPITWNTLVEALRDARMDQLADKLITALPNIKDG